MKKWYNDFIIDKKLLFCEDTVKRIRKQATAWEKISAKHTFKWLYSKQSNGLAIGKQTTLRKSGKYIVADSLPKKTNGCKNKHIKRCSCC